MISMSVKNNISLPKLNFQEDLVIIAKTIMIPDMATAINNQVAIDGGAYPALEPKTIAKKSGQLMKARDRLTGTLARGKKVDIAGYGKQTVIKGMDKGKARAIATSALGSYKTLIETGELLRSFLFKKRGKDTVIIYLNSKRADIGKYLQIDGVGKKKKHFNFFGINSDMEAKAIQYMKNKIKEGLRSGR